MSDIDLSKTLREQVRWRILRILDVGRPGGVTEDTLQLALDDARLPVTPHELRRELDYLEDRKLITIIDRDTSTWSAELTHHGVDVVEYTVPCLPGIARPPRR
ncbi:hypothetical protein MBSD_n1582 [Mizugakiibacter sediminis]|uniref:Uncharacterized protein n=1 Tax=Mizugakiibacter sediminis TaxID=1475481 RepID=A0A0K8QN40_9GAMM|nr:hypothetical protein [Mizugakiibacter sediminis]GAP66278.1 hypothetical protein MBSD_n1582 [Mizugakiibacter sediminis]